MDDKVLVVGCGGMLGKAVHDIFPNGIYTDIDINESWLEYCDVRDFSQCENFVKDVDLVINLAAITDMEVCERDTVLAYTTNEVGARNLSTLCTKYDKELVYISTAGIFSYGIKEFFTDKDKPCPLSVYAKSKYGGEINSLFHKKSYVIRAGWMFGGGNKDKKFIMKIFKQVKNNVRELYVVNDKKGTPTYTNDFAKGIKNIVESKKYGVYNQVCEGYTNRLEVAYELVKNLNKDIIISEVGSYFFKNEYYAMRPENEVLKNSDGVIMRHWKECLKEYCEQELKVML
jgi:dTDP-4-dehydrorhamnose reductase